MSRITIDKNTIFIDCNPNLQTKNTWVVHNESLISSDLCLDEFYNYLNKNDKYLLSTIKHVVVKNYTEGTDLNLQNFPNLVSIDINKSRNTFLSQQNITKQPLKMVKIFKVCDCVILDKCLLKMLPNLKILYMNNVKFTKKDIDSKPGVISINVNEEITK
ncbi:MAG: hypothetical protein E7376_01990 [Clostridiales bacterium]|nr:hypothetical protein [Clostridiales bacterium]